ncbi:MAG: carboxypeptidase-like regulatory domain-containing protein [Actinomycetota bacterium]
MSPARHRARSVRRTYVRPPALVVGALVLLAACGTRVGPAGRDSGVTGTVTVGPRCPVVQAESPCPDTPFVGKVEITMVGKGTVADATLDAQGSYRVPLEPGTYTIQPVIAGGGPPTAGPKTIVVRAGSFVTADITIDTGIR